MDNKIVVALIGSFLIFAAGLLRLFTESLSSTPLFVAYIFIITGILGIITNGLKLGKSKNT
ncbi:hypothetical protein MHI39_14770 [Heyndrickxia sp. FSL K6-6286]|jgi:uncharacterized membrane protein|uniref:Uncharacterized protein n=1 Tax=Heyndrickxia oleronia TaxID=38875 RepID=A0A8E2LBW1_9BACI|nr:hypothetical protein [Heyndrickxia oleronia]NYV67899.1 hypothetical protein [Bacillus sp. Gen3]OJH19093.1 hypothetical protein BLX88_07770 [Bacillus obstructivus]MBU5210667.1 hypothetical protein [Heyndrickxia oleronia]MEC1375214.1 hypothetical protein [Heyndrickxia oleronia]OOP61391.1 hypothetical protein BWZ43_25760 [Heyndrickxia oleronia]